jgi:signal transduction histidine kinase
MSTPHPRVSSDALRTATSPGADRLEQAATQLVRELHDGVMQSLTAAVLQLEAVVRLMDTDPQAAHGRIRDVQQMIRREQHELRSWAERLECAVHPVYGSGVQLAAPMEALCERIGKLWNLQVELSIEVEGSVSGGLAEQLQWFVQEALTNAGRHARAHVAFVGVNLGPLSDRMRIVVADDGSGFPFRGRFDLTQLTQRRIGPTSLRRRAAALGGELIVTSQLSGSRLEIGLPVREYRNVTDLRAPGDE